MYATFLVSGRDWSLYLLTELLFALYWHCLFVTEKQQLDDSSDTSSSDEDQEHDSSQEKKKTGVVLYINFNYLLKCFYSICSWGIIVYNLSFFASHLGKKVKQRGSKLSAVQMLSDKYEKKAELKQKELEIRKLELDLQKRKFEEETEERKMRFTMEMEERRMMLELLQNKM